MDKLVNFIIYILKLLNYIIGLSVSKFLQKMNFKLVIIVILFYSSTFTVAQVTIAPSSIKWYTLNEAMELAKSNPRPIIVDVYTEWCSWCTYMMKTTFANQGIANYINTNFYAARLNAESKDTIVFKGEKYFNRNVGFRPTHDLASLILEGKLNYPALVFFDRQGNRTVVSGYKEAKDIEPYLVYFAENLNRKVELDKFIVDFMFSFPEAFQADHSIFKVDNSLRPDTLGAIDWISPENVMHLNKKHPKPVFMYFYAEGCISCKVMEQTSFGNREISQKINENYVPVKVNSNEVNDINFIGKTYKTTGVNQPNQFTLQFLNTNLTMPSIVIFDENYNVLARIEGFMTKEKLLPLTEYFYNKTFKKLSLQEYFRTYVTQNQQTTGNSIN